MKCCRHIPHDQNGRRVQLLSSYAHQRPHPLSISFAVVSATEMARTTRVVTRSTALTERSHSLGSATRKKSPRQTLFNTNTSSRGRKAASPLARALKRPAGRRRKEEICPGNCKTLRAYLRTREHKIVEL